MESVEVLAESIIAKLHFAKQENISHNDIKPQNIVYKTNEDDSFGFDIIDFGLASQMSNSNSVTKTSQHPRG